MMCMYPIYMYMCPDALYIIHVYVFTYSYIQKVTLAVRLWTLKSVLQMTPRVTTTKQVPTIAMPLTAIVCANALKDDVSSTAQCADHSTCGSFSFAKLKANSPFGPTAHGSAQGPVSSSTTPTTGRGGLNATGPILMLVMLRW